MCDRIREDDERNTKIRADSNLNKCIDVNILLEGCLKKNERDFRKCKNEVIELKKCMNYKSGENSNSEAANNKK
jgi:hypothetical protein